MALADTNHGGDFEAADAAIFESLHLGLRRYAAVVGSLGEDPDDLVQEAVTRVLRNGSLAELDNPSDIDILEMLSPIERAILLLIDVDGLGFNEVSRIVGISPVAARIRASRARKHLRQLLGDNQ